MDKWLSQIYEGNEEAITQLVGKYTTPLRRFLLGMLKNEEDAKELVQETFLRFISHPQKFVDISQMRNYLFQIAHNIAITKLTSASSRREELTDEFKDNYYKDESATSMLLLEGKKREVFELLSKLPPQQRRVVILRNWEEMSFKEIAEVLSLSEGTVKAHYFFALKKLKEEIIAKRGKEVVNG